MSIAGKHLWSVGLSGASSSLWITTAKKDVSIAISKAKAVISKSVEYKDCEIESVSNHGFIDA